MTKIELKCGVCGASAELEGENLDGGFAVAMLKRLGWMIGSLVCLCPECHRRGERNLIDQIMSGEVFEDEE